MEQRKRGSLLGAILLIAGSCIGAGMLGLPVLTGVAGFVPSIVTFVIAWLFMMTTGLLVLETNLWFGCKASFVTMATRTLGKAGKWLSWLIFLFLFYCLNVAYIDVGSHLVITFLIKTAGIELSYGAAAVVFTGLFGLIVYMGARVVDGFNRVLMVGLIVTYFLLASIGSSHVQIEYLTHRYWPYALISVPVLIISFGYHNMIPSLVQYLGGDKRRLRMAVIVGSSLPLIIYIIWEYIILGIVPIEGIGGLFHALNQGEAATTALARATNSVLVSFSSYWFAFFAITTSFLGQSLSLVDFLADGLKLDKRSGSITFFLCLLAMLPGLVFTLSLPNLFLTALGYAGGFGAVVIFGVMPALMVWKLRYRQKVGQEPLLFGGKTLLVVITAFALTVLGLQVAQEIGWSLLPPDSEMVEGEVP